MPSEVAEGKLRAWELSSLCRSWQQVFDHPVENGLKEGSTR